ncbi:hypothetical protein SAMN02745181_0511 [Rubritalea squalenifaciens DSM 18772]|uniref:Uncharacterized protein n=1 Tax=Rubritalea squalenifaciens DSM 18772 TaxID=1123071 RepID=A0A1M6CLN5_9BACT|nr:hypothetical protein [Rubritalea squalenifaciens]SHI61869.1 hypothetical protein SAMN02745181_0511 [Rubritalea squalenifaciens DSM 18772]
MKATKNDKSNKMRRPADDSPRVESSHDENLNPQSMRGCRQAAGVLGR